MSRPTITMKSERDRKMERLNEVLRYGNSEAAWGALGATNWAEINALPEDVIDGVLLNYDKVGCTVRREPATDYSGERATIGVLLPSGRGADVSVYGPDFGFGGTKPAYVNWSAIGASSSEDALVYASALALAAALAPTLSGPTKEA